MSCSRRTQDVGNRLLQDFSLLAEFFSLSSLLSLLGDFGRTKCEGLLWSEADVSCGLEWTSQPFGYSRRRIQPVNATHSLNISAGVWKPSVLRGLSFNCLAIALSCSCE